MEGAHVRIAGRLAPSLLLGPTQSQTRELGSLYVDWACFVGSDWPGKENADKVQRAKMEGVVQVA